LNMKQINKNCNGWKGERLRGNLCNWITHQIRATTHQSRQLH